jgi:hypothetical protein|tara:strand:- start:91254 stop:91496 length:243 start_codon:yes stop_codon:yes gene_type:complete
MNLLSFFLNWSFKMANQSAKNNKAQHDHLPKIILIPSQNSKIDGHKKSEEILYYLTQIILLSDKKGRPSKNQFPEVQDAI